jgi:hypothetical protein
LAGARWTHLRLELDGDGPIGENEDQHQSWIDPIFGVQVGIDLSERWVLVTAADIGGFGIGSDFTWNALGLIGYRTSVFGADALLSAGYRALSWDYEDDGFTWDMVMQGPFVGSSFRF